MRHETPARQLNLTSIVALSSVYVMVNCLYTCEVIIARAGATCCSAAALHVLHALYAEDNMFNTRIQPM